MQRRTPGACQEIVRSCTLPLTSVRRVDLIVTELAVIEPTDAGLVLRETTPRVSVEQAVRATAARLLVPETVGTNARVAALRSRAGRCSQAPQGRDRDRP